MEKNNFLIYNEIVFNLYSCKKKDDLAQKLLLPLKILIPFSYSSILLADTETEATFQENPICYPESFSEAENEYIKHSEDDPLKWLTNSQESTLIRESDLVAEERRLNSPLYIRCYKKYSVFDTLQYNIVYNHKFLGVITLFRTKIDGIFTEDNMFFLRSLGAHIQVVINQIFSDNSNVIQSNKVENFCKKYNFTKRESEILNLLSKFCSNEEIAEKLDISEHTIQKHYQNIFKKANVYSKWNLIKLMLN